jgi:hypothetical protein
VKKRIAFLREPGAGQRIWAGVRYLEPGAAIIASVPSQPELVHGPGVTSWTPNTTPRHEGGPTLAFQATGPFSPTPFPARPAYIGTVHATSVRAWQSGWSPTWETLTGMRPDLRGSLYGPQYSFKQGTAAMFPATVYQAGPSLGAVAHKMV